MFIKRITQILISIIFTLSLLFSSMSYESYNDYGWLKKPEGKCVIVSVYLSDDNTGWDIAQIPGMDSRTGRDVDLAYNTLGYLKIAAAYIEKQVKNYGRDVEFIYDWSQPETSDLILQAHIDCSSADRDEFLSAIDDILFSEEGKKDYYLKKYKTQNIAYMIFLNTDEDNMLPSESYMWITEGDYEDEFSVIRNISEGKQEGPSVYAHELLHLFGAPDLYYAVADDEDDIKITQEYVEHLQNIQSDDIMFTVYERDGYSTRYTEIIHSFSELDAYYLGLTDHSSDAEEFGLGQSIFFKSPKQN